MGRKGKKKGGGGGGDAGPSGGEPSQQKTVSSSAPPTQQGGGGGGGGDRDGRPPQSAPMAQQGGGFGRGKPVEGNRGGQGDSGNDGGSRGRGGQRGGGGRGQSSDGGGRGGQQGGGKGRGSDGGGRGGNQPAAATGGGQPSAGRGWGPPAASTGGGQPSAGAGGGQPSAGRGWGQPAASTGGGQPSAGTGGGQPAAGRGWGQPAAASGGQQGGAGRGWGQPAAASGGQQGAGGGTGRSGAPAWGGRGLPSGGDGPPPDMGHPPGMGPPPGMGSPPGFGPPPAKSPPGLGPPPAKSPPGFGPPPAKSPPQQVQPEQQLPSPRPEQLSQSPRPSGEHPRSSSSSSASSQKSLVSQMQSMGVSSYGFLPKSKGPGTVGRKIMLETNHLAITISDHNVKIYHYDVEVKPDKPFRLYRKVVEAFRLSRYPQNFFGFDGRKNIFTTKMMDTETVEDLVIRDDEKSEDHKGIEYRVVVKYANEFRLSKLFEYFKNGSSISPPQLMIQALDVALRNPAHQNPSFVSVGRSFFTPPKNEKISLGGGLTLWHGFYQSMVLGTWKPFLNVDVAHKGFPEAVNCVTAYSNITGSDPQSPVDRYGVQNFAQYMKGLKVIYEIPHMKNSKRTYRITGLADSPQDKKFPDDKEGNRVTTIADYFARKKNCPLKFKHLPCLQAGPKTKDRDVCLPLELCTIMEGQVSNKKLDEKQTAVMVRSAARPTDERKSKIMKSVELVNYNRDPCVKQFGITVNTQFEQIPARIVPAPKLNYAQGSATVNKGVWNAGCFVKSFNIDNWAIVNLDFRTDDRRLNEVVKEFSRFSRDVGMTVNKPDMRTIKTGRNEDIRHQLTKTFEEFQEKKVKLILVIIPSFGDAYGKVKQVAELHIGVLTQCLKAKTLLKLNQSTVVNILQKVNAKLNGTNHSLALETSSFNFLNKPTVIFGADVTHPSPDQTDIPSVAAVTCSFDVYAFRYNVEWQVQEARLEVIKDLKDIVKNHLLAFYRINKCKPHRIVFYRDGVSEGQFKQILESEVVAIRSACKSLQNEYEPPLTFLVVQKRHHTRFFPQARDADGRNKNVPAGTVVDTDITHPTEKDFYLNSHASIQGTSKPSKYHVLWDDADKSMDELQVMTYYLCHLFTRCTRAISYPAPTYYAHLAAFRIRAYCEGRSMDLWEFEKNDKLKEVQKRLSLAHPMFFV